MCFWFLKKNPQSNFFFVYSVFLFKNSIKYLFANLKLTNFKLFNSCIIFNKFVSSIFKFFSNFFMQLLILLFVYSSIFLIFTWEFSTILTLIIFKSSNKTRNKSVLFEFRNIWFPGPDMWRSKWSLKIKTLGLIQLQINLGWFLQIQQLIFISFTA